MRTALFVAIVAAALSFLVALSRLHDIFLGCDYGTIGLGRPACEAQIPGNYLMLALSLAVGIITISAALLITRRLCAPR